MKNTLLVLVPVALVALVALSGVSCEGAGNAAVASAPSEEICAQLRRCNNKLKKINKQSKLTQKKLVKECSSAWSLDVLLGCSMSSGGGSSANATIAEDKDNVKIANALDFGDALRKSVLFYDAQRSGDLPSPFKISWRGDSTLNDKTPNGKTLASGFFDAGDHLKLGFNLAHTLSVLSFSVIEFRQGFVNANAMESIRNILRLMGAYLRNSFYNGRNLVVNVGGVDADHGYWGRPEDMTMARPVKTIAPGQGSDMYAYVAGALALAATALKPTDLPSSNSFAAAAEQIYAQAKVGAGSKYTDAPQFAEERAAFVYVSSRAYDKLFTAALALHQLTGKPAYLADARQWMDIGDGAIWWPALTWDNMWPMGLLLCVSRDAQRAPDCLSRLNAGADQWLNARRSSGPFSEGQVAHRPDGLRVMLNWGSLGTTASYSLVAQALAKRVGGANSARATALRCFAASQIKYMLGQNPRGFSYMIGFGTSYPLRPHHRGASCPNRPAPCGWNNFYSAGPNPQVLTGALVGGPRQDGLYQDSRADYQTNEVATNFNSGLTGALAAIMQPENMC